MYNTLRQKKCEIHQENTVACDLDLEIEDDERYLCIKCLTKRIPQWNMIFLNSEVEEKFHLMKLNQFEDKRKQINLHLGKLMQLHSKFIEFQNWINDRINTSINLVNQRIEEIQYELEQTIKPTIEFIEDEDLINLSIHQSTQNLKQMIDEDDDIYENAFIDLIYQQINKLKDDKKIQEIIKQLKILQRRSVIEQSVVLNDYYQLNQSKKTLSLSYCCNKHQKEIIMVNLEPGNYENRFFCVFCIQENQVKLSSLSEADNQWQEHKQNIIDSDLIFYMQRLEKFNKLDEIILNLKKQQSIFLNELVDGNNNNCEEISQQIENLELKQDHRSLLQLNQQQIEDIVNELSQEDRMDNANEIYYQIKQNDSEYQIELIHSLQKLKQKINESLQQIYDVLEMDIKQILSNENMFITDTLKQFYQYLQNLQVKELELSFFEFFSIHLQTQYQVFQFLFKLIIDQLKIHLKNFSKYNQNNSFTEQQRQKLKKQKVIFQKFQRICTDCQNFDDQEVQTYQNLKIQKLQENFYQLKYKISKFTINSLHQSFYNSLNDSFSSKNYLKQLKFSTYLKHHCIEIIGNGKIAKTIGSSECIFAVALLNSPIPKNGIYSIKIKIFRVKHIMVGICLNDSIKKDYNFSNYCTIGHGFYVLYSNGYLYSHHDSQYNYQKNGFTFESGDIIQIEVNQQTKIITWRNFLKQQQCTLDYQSNSDLYFCCIIYQSNQQSEIELV